MVEDKTMTATNNHNENDNTESCCCLPDEERPTVVEVKAPSTLHEGYKFWATCQGHQVPITVPEGGIEEGETLRVVVPPASFEANKQQSTTNSSSSSSSSVSSSIEKGSSSEEEGQWKDGILDCCKYGAFHPTLWHGCCCPQILTSQILARMNLGWALEPAQGPYRTMLVVFLVIFFIDHHTSSYTFYNYDLTNGFSWGNSPWWRYLLYGIPGVFMSIYSMKVSVDLRAHVRNKYNISTGRLGIFEDWFCMMACHSCALAQIARQTTDYKRRFLAATSTTSLIDDNDVNMKDNENNQASSSSSYCCSKSSSPSSCCAKDGLPSTKERIDCILLLV